MDFYAVLNYIFTIYASNTFIVILYDFLCSFIIYDTCDIHSRVQLKTYLVEKNLQFP